MSASYINKRKQEDKIWEWEQSCHCLSPLTLSLSLSSSSYFHLYLGYNLSTFYTFFLFLFLLLNLLLLFSVVFLNSPLLFSSQTKLTASNDRYISANLCKYSSHFSVACFNDRTNSIQLTPIMCFFSLHRCSLVDKAKFAVLVVAVLVIIIVVLLVF